MNIEEILAPKILQVIEKMYQIPFDTKAVQLQKTKKEFEGDVTLVVFPFSKAAGKSPAETANQIGEALKSESDLISSFNVVQGFLNLSISPSHWIGQLKEINQNANFGNSPDKKETIMVEYSSPNTNKPLHLGHLRNIFLGHSVSEILNASGKKVIKTQIVNDRGIHICKSMLAWQRYGNGETPQSSGLKGDKLVGKYYVAFDKAMRDESKAIQANWSAGKFENTPSDIVAEYRRLKQAMEEKEDEKSKKGIEGKVKELANSQTPIMAEVKQMLLAWESGDKDVYQLWQKMNGWVYEGFDMTYKMMGVNFHKIYYESDTYIYGKEMVEEGLQKAVFFKKEDGSVWVDLTEEGLDQKIVLRADGTAVYMTQDIGTARQRFKDFPDITGIIYTVGNEQDYHFKVLFQILKKLGYSWSANCHHLSYGMVEIPEGKMKSREGTVVDADDLMDEVISTAKEMTQERGHIDGMDETEKENLYRIIGLGALKYFLLKIDPQKRIMYNPSESVDLNGNTGPFIQYAHARIASLVRKAESIRFPEKPVELQHSEIELIKHLSAYPDIISEAATLYSPALIANYAFDLVKHYNSFYQSVSIFKEEDEDKRNLRLVLSYNVGKVIKSSMKMLGIEVPERM
jgi:arginyl-tRNA synthetase